MKQKFVKILAMSMATLCAVSMTAFADSETENTEQTEQAQTEEAPQQEMTEEEMINAALKQTSEGITGVLINLSESDIEDYKKSKDEFTLNAVNAWESVKDDVEEFVEVGEAEIKNTEDTYEVTVIADYEPYDVEFVYTFEDPVSQPTSVSINVDYPMSVTLKNAALNTAMGVGIVFVMLLFLSFVIKLMGNVCQSIQNKPQPKKEPVPAPVAVPVVEEIVEDEVDDTELVAVLAAAVAAYEGTTPDGLVVRSVRKVNRRKW